MLAVAERLADADAGVDSVPLTVWHGECVSHAVSHCERVSDGQRDAVSNRVRHRFASDDSVGICDGVANENLQRHWDVHPECEAHAICHRVCHA